MTRKALIVGVNYYENLKPLYGCVDDAHAMKQVLDRHGGGAVNFSTRLLTGTGSGDPVGREELKGAIRELFQSKDEIALFYFAGHGCALDTGGYLCPSDAATGDDGIPLAEVLTLAANSKARNKVLLLDSCNSGAAAESQHAPHVSELPEGMTVLTAATADQYAKEDDRGGVFTTLLVDALQGAAANLVGDITPGSVYAHIDQSLGPWQQRPVFKTNVRSFVSLREVQPPIELRDLRRIAEFFPERGFEFTLDPTFEPERDPPSSEGLPDPVPENTRTFAILQKLNRVNLVEPVDAPHMYHAAIESKSCRLTVLGEHYRRLVADDLI